MAQSIKTVGANGQISLGKNLAGKMVLVDQLDEGSWIIKVGAFIPDNEKWLYQGDNMAKLDRALARLKTREPIDNFEELVEKIEKSNNYEEFVSKMKPSKKHG